MSRLLLCLDTINGRTVPVEGSRIQPLPLLQLPRKIEPLGVARELYRSIFGSSMQNDSRFCGANTLEAGLGNRRTAVEGVLVANRITRPLNPSILFTISIRLDRTVYPDR